MTATTTVKFHILLESSWHLLSIVAESSSTEETLMPEVGWLPDMLYRGGRFERGVAMFADENGMISRFSNAPKDLADAYPLPGRALLPGFINAHSHSFQRAIRARTEHRSNAARDSFWTWREIMYRAARHLSPEEIGVCARMAFLEMALSGITTVGEFHYLHHAPDGTPYTNRNLLAEIIVEAARDIGLRIALLRCAYVRAGWNREPNPAQARFITPAVDDFIADTEKLRSLVRNSFALDGASVGVAPHSVRAVPLEYLRQIVGYARAENLPVHMHVAEQPAEVEECLTEHDVRAVTLLHDSGLLDRRFTAVHAIHVDDEELSALAHVNAGVCACPTTERNLGDGPLPADRALEKGIPICLGSDSNIQIDPLEDARQLEYNLRMTKLERSVLDRSGQGTLAQRLFETATRNGAASIGAPGGELEIGRAADFFNVDLNDTSIAGADGSSLLSHVVFCLERTAVREVYVGGKQIVSDGQHVLQDEVTRQFNSLQTRLWGAAAVYSSSGGVLNQESPHAS
jgi:formimidoylglutamate deiminase